MAATAARAIARFATSLDAGALPPEVAEATKLHVLDTLGCGLAAHALGAGTAGRAALAAAGPGGGPSTVLGLAEGAPPGEAAFANAMLCHALDYDDTHSDAVAHITVAVAPAALAVAEAEGRSGAEALTAIAVATEVVARLGMAASSRFHARGFHPTSVCGVFGAAAASARLLGLDAQTATAALGLAGSMSSGLLAFLDEGTPTKPLHPALAAQGGVRAATLAAHGAAGPASVLEARFGLFDAFVGDREAPIREQVADLGERWESLRVSYKAYPACHYMHGVLGAVEQVRAEADPDRIEEIVLTVPEAAVQIVLEPAEAKLAPRSDYEGKFSAQYSVAALLLHGRVNLGTYSAAALGDPAVLALARKVRYEVRPYPTYPQAFPGGVRIRLADGRLLEADVPYQRGAPENPLSAEDVRAKFRDNAGLALPPAQVAALEEAICTLDERSDVRAALAPLTAAGATAATRARAPVAS